MASFKDARDLPLDSFDDYELSGDEFLLLKDLNRLNYKFHVVVLQRTARSYAEVRAARAVRLIFLIRANTFLALSLPLPSSLLKFNLSKMVTKTTKITNS